MNSLQMYSGMKCLLLLFSLTNHFLRNVSLALLYTLIFSFQASPQPALEQALLINEDGIDEPCFISTATSLDLSGANTASSTSTSSSQSTPSSSLASTPLPSPSNIPKNKKKKMNDDHFGEDYMKAVKVLKDSMWPDDFCSSFAKTVEHWMRDFTEDTQKKVAIQIYEVLSSVGSEGRVPK